MIFNDRLKELRIGLGLTQRQVAIKSNITERAYQRYESGEQKPGFDAIIALADALDVSTDYLLGRVDNAEINK